MGGAEGGSRAWAEGQRLNSSRAFADLGNLGGVDTLGVQQASKARGAGHDGGAVLRLLAHRVELVQARAQRVEGHPAEDRHEERHNDPEPVVPRRELRNLSGSVGVARGEQRRGRNQAVERPLREGRDGRHWRNPRAARTRGARRRGRSRWSK